MWKCFHFTILLKKSTLDHRVSNGSNKNVNIQCHDAVPLPFSLLLLQVDSMPRPAIPYVRCAAERGSAYPRFSRWDYQFTARKKRRV